MQLHFQRINTVQKKMTIHKKHDRLLHRKSRFFIAIKGVCLSSDIVPSRKALKGVSQNIYQMLDLLSHISYDRAIHHMIVIYVIHV